MLRPGRHPPRVRRPPAEALAAVIEETEARWPVMNLIRDAKVDLRLEWLRSSSGALEPVARH